MKARAHPGTLLKGVKWPDGTEMFKSGLLLNVNGETLHHTSSLPQQNQLWLGGG